MNPEHDEASGASPEADNDPATFREAQRRSDAPWSEIPRSPAKFRVLTGERPTGSLHIGHLFGTVANRVRIRALGVETFLVIADYQVLTDRDTADAIADSVLITYEPERRPEDANLRRLVGICTGRAPEDVAADIGDGGGGKLKAQLTEALNAHLAPMRERRPRYAADEGYVQSVLRRGIVRATEEAEKTLREVRAVMNMQYGL